MAYQLIYTSVSRGLIPGRSGYTVAARHRQIRDRMVSDIERISGYTFATSGVSPVIYAHRMISCSGKEYHVLTRNMDAGSDYTGRTNHLAHHLICEPEEISECGASPAEILHGFNWLESYADEPRYLEDHEIIDLGQFAGTFKLPAKNWQGVRGSAGDAALLIDDKGKPGSAFVVASSSDEDEAKKLLAMYAESLQLVTSSDDTPATWKASFTTYLQQVDTLADFDWAGCMADHALLQRPGNRMVLNLSAIDVPTPGSKQAKLAVTGRAEPPPPTQRLPVKPPQPDALRQQASPVPQSGLGGQGMQQAGQSRRVTFTPVDAKGEVKTGGSVKLRGSSPLPVSSVAMQSSGEGPLNFLKRPENLRIVLGGVAAATLVLGILCYYLFSIHPRQDFQSDVKGNIANSYWQGAMDVIDKEKENMDTELIEELRREVIKAMIVQAEEVNERYATEKGENVQKLREEVSGRLEKLVQFEKKYDLSNEDIEDLAASFERIKKTKSNAGGVNSGNSGLASSGKETSPGDVPETKPELPGEETNPANKTKDPPANVVAEQEEVLPNSVYLFLNDQSVGLDKVQFNESWASLQNGKVGERKVNLRHYGLGPGTLLLLDPSAGDQYSYKFPESAEEESSGGYFPIDGDLNIKVMFKGAKTALLKRDGAGNDSKNAWDAALSNLFAFEGQGNRFQVLLWNGVPFKVTKVKPFTMSGKVVSVTDGFGRYLASFKAGDAFGAKAEPTEIFMRYVSGRSSAGEKLFFESDHLKVPMKDNHRQLQINFGANGNQNREDVAGLERRINEAKEAVGNYESYRRWFNYREGLKKDLGQMGRDYITRFKEKDYPQICDPGNFSKEDDVREQILEFAEDMVNGFPDALEDQDVADSDVRKVTFSLSAKKFSELSFATTVANFKRGMDAFAESCRDLAGSSYRDDDGDRVYRIRDRDAREEIEEFSKRWEDFFCGEKGERLWHFVTAKPQVPKMTEKEYSLKKRRLTDLMKRKVLAEKSSKRFDFLDGSGMPTGIYEIVLVFGGDKQMPFVIWNKEGKRSR